MCGGGQWPGCGQPRRCLTEYFEFLCTFSNVSEASIGNYFNVAVFKAIFVNVLILLVVISR